MVLLFVCRQQIVFRVERSADSATFGGGSNAEVSDQLDDLQENPVPDFITYTKYDFLATLGQKKQKHCFYANLSVTTK